MTKNNDGGTYTGEGLGQQPTGGPTMHDRKYETTTDAAAVIRAAFKAKGWNSRQISVRTDYYSMGSSINVEIKDAAIPYYEAEAIAEGKERIDRCELTGEILSGGNRFVHVTMSNTARLAKGARFMPAVEQAWARFQPETSDRTLHEIVPGFLLGRGMHGDRFALWSSKRGHIQECWDLINVAVLLALEMEREGRKLEDANPPRPCAHSDCDKPSVTVLVTKNPTAFYGECAEHGGK